MKDAPYEILLIVGGIIAAALIMMFAFTRINKAEETAAQADAIVDQMVDSLENGKYTTYDGAIVKGSDVLSCIQTNKSQTICVEVVNGSTTTQYIRKSSDLATKADGVLAEAKNKANVSTTYIDPSVSYLGEVMYYNDDSTQTIIGVRFTRQ